MGGGEGPDQPVGPDDSTADHGLPDLGADGLAAGGRVCMASGWFTG